MANEFIARNGITSLGNIVVSGSITTTGTVAISGSIASASFAATASSADNFLTRGTLTAQTLVVQTITSSVMYSSGSNIFGNNIANTQVLTGSVTVTGSLAVVTNGTEFQVTSTGVRLGNIIGDTHTITGSVNVSGSATFSGSIAANSFVATSTGNANVFNAASATTGWVQIAMNNTNGSAILAIESNTAGTTTNGSLAYATILRNYTATALQFATNNIVRTTITSDGNVGIGTSSPNNNAGYASLTINGSTGGQITLRTGNVTEGYLYNTSSGLILGADLGNFLAFDTNTTEKMRITSDGNVGIGTSSPGGKLEVYAATPTIICGATTADSLHGIEFRQSNTVDAFIKQLPSTGEFRFNVGRNSSWGGNMTFWTDTVQRMFISSGGEVRIQGAGSSQIPFSIYDGSSRRVFCIPSQYYGYIFAVSVAADGGKAISIGSTSAEVGSIVANSSSTTYNTTSDYRLKEDLKDFNGLEKVSAIKVYDFKWKSNEERTNGVLAHELAEVLPYAVHGEKDAIGLDDKPSYQGVDYSKIVPSLVKAIQELTARVQELENK